MERLQDIIMKNKDFVTKCVESYEIIKQECDDYFKEIDLFLKTGNADYFKANNEEKENIDQVVVTNKRKGRSRKPALVDLIENNVQQTASIIIKREKVSDIQEVHDDSDLNVEIKKEAEEMPAPTRLPPRKKKIKVEKLDVPKRSTRTRTKKIEGGDNDITRISKNSDVIIQNTTITTIEISDNEKETDSETNSQTVMRNTRSKMKKPTKPVASEDSVKESSNKELSDEEKGKNMRSTRTKTRQKKRGRSNSTEHPSSQTEKKRSKSDSNSEKDLNATRRTEYEDALCVIENNQDKPQPAADATYIASSSSKNSEAANENTILSVNATVVVENPKIVTKEIEKVVSTQKEEIAGTPPKLAKKNGNKQIFSPFEKTPVKKKVEAFERLGVESSGIPTRLTRTKKKNQKNDAEQKEENEIKLVEKTKHSTEKLTPIVPKYISKVCSTSKINKQHPPYSSNTSTSNESILSVKSASALKASQAEFREREKRRQEKERDALRKREALLQAQSEEKRRKREEKQQRAQQQREKESLKQLEAQRIREEKYKQAMAERDKKLQQQKEEAEKKQQMAKKKANELLKEKEEGIRLAEQKKFAEMKAVLDKQGEMTRTALKHKMERAQHPTRQPLYMITKPPLLPTDDCYDSDDDEYDSNKRVEPAWSKDRELRDMQLAMITAGETIKNSFFCRQAHTPDLQDIFEIIDPRKLKRTSSAIWRKPPRYTLMPMLEDTIEFSEDSD